MTNGVVDGIVQRKHHRGAVGSNRREVRTELDVDSKVLAIGDGRPATRVLSARQIMNIQRGWENVREAAGWDRDVMVHCSWNYDLRTSIQIAEAVAPARPVWLEDPMAVP